MVIISKAQIDGQNQPLEGQEGRDPNEDEPPLSEPGLPGFRSESTEVKEKEPIGVLQNVDTSNISIIGEDVVLSEWDGNSDTAHLFTQHEIAVFLQVNVKSVQFLIFV
jgi:hypothetical protein